MKRTFLACSALACLFGCSGFQDRSHHHSSTSSAHRAALAVGESRDRQSCENTDSALHCVNVTSVYDGDTLFIDIPDVPPVLGKRIGVRILGMDTPELHSLNACEKRKGLEAKAALVEMLRGAKRVDIIDVKRDKYFRILGTVLIDGRSATQELIRRKLAYPYHGEKKPKRNWCR